MPESSKTISEEIETYESPVKSQILSAKKAGLCLSVDHPEIAKEYLEGATFKEIADKYRVAGMKDFPNYTWLVVIHALKSLLPNHKAIIEAEIKGFRSAVFIEIADLGQRLSDWFPEIAEDYRNGLSLNEIVDKYEVQKLTNFPNAAKSIVSFCIKILISDEDERAEIAHAHQVARGEGLRDRGEGIFSRTGEERSRFEKEKAMRIPKNIRHKRAVAMGRGSTKAKGLKTWDELVDPETGMNEGDMALWLTLEMKRTKGRAKGNPDYERIHQEIERRFLKERGYERKVGSLRKYILRRAKSLGIEL